MQQKAYRVFSESEWKDFQESRQFWGSDDDLWDGFIHLSVKNQVTAVNDSFFKQTPLYVAELTYIDFLKRLTWETSKSKDIYPP